MIRTVRICWYALIDILGRSITMYWNTVISQFDDIKYVYRIVDSELQYMTAGVSPMVHLWWLLYAAVNSENGANGILCQLSYLCYDIKVCMVSWGRCSVTSLILGLMPTSEALHQTSMVVKQVSKSFWRLGVREILSLQDSHTTWNLENLENRFALFQLEKSQGI